jgi:hypothetical protein
VQLKTFTVENAPVLMRQLLSYQRHDGHEFGGRQLVNGWRAPGRERRRTSAELIQVDATGRVAVLRVLEPGGDDFEAAAMEAMKNYIFTPATEV